MSQHDASARRRRSSLAAIAAAVIGGMVFLIDIRTPLGINVPLLYIVPVVLTLWRLRARDPLIVAGACAGLLLVRVVVAPEGDWWLGLVNRALTSLGLLLTAVLVVRFKQASEALARLGAIVDASRDAIVGETIDGMIADWNPGAERLFGYAPEEIVGRSSDVLAPFDRRAELEGIRARLSSGEPIDDFDTVRLTKRGEPVAVSLSVSPLCDAAGRIVGMSTAARDVSARVHAERETRLREARIRSILETAPDGILVIDEHGAIQLANPAVERLFGYRSAALIGRTLSSLIPGVMGVPWHAAAGGPASSSGLAHEAIGVRSDGHRFPVAIAIGEMHTDSGRAFTGVVRDLTEQKRHQALLQEQAELARLGQMAVAVSHEVRNALAGIGGVLQVMGGRLPDTATNRMIRAETTKRVWSLDRFVSDLLTLAQARPPAFTRCRLIPVLERAIDSLKNDPQFERIAVRVDGPDLEVELDPCLVAPALLNLLRNAAQAMQDDGTVVVEVAASDGICRLAIHDNGPGIAPDVRARMFEPFFTTKHQGTGLGLAIAQRTIRQHAGTIDVSSDGPSGTTVVVSLPVTRSGAGPWPARTPESPGASADA